MPSDRQVLDLVADRAHRVALTLNLSWLAANLYEAIVDVPTLLATSPSAPTRPLDPRSPARYLLMIVPVAVPATTISSCRHRTASHIGFTLTTTGIVTALATTAMLIRTINLPLMRRHDDEVDALDLIDRWRQINRARTLALASTILGQVLTSRATITTPPPPRA